MRQISYDSYSSTYLALKITGGVFKDQTTNQSVQISDLLVAELPRMMNKDTADIHMARTEAIVFATVVIILLSMTIHMIFSSSLKTTWCFINTLQLIVYLALIQANIAA